MHTVDIVFFKYATKISENKREKIVGTLGRSLRHTGWETQLDYGSWIKKIFYSIDKSSIEKNYASIMEALIINYSIITRGWKLLIYNFQ